jgi:hypothetical protein
LRDAVAEGPVFLGYFDEVDDDVFAAQFEPFVQSVGDGFVEGFLELDGAAGVERDLDDDAVGRARDVEISRVGDEVLRGVLGDDLKAVVLGDIQGGAHGVVDDVTDGAAVVGGFSFNEIDAGEGHGFWRVDLMTELPN